VEIARRLGDGAVGALDGGRRWVWRQLARTATGRSCARDRSRRVLVLGLGHVAAAVVLLAVGAPLLLVWSPIVLGVPHVVADVRYLVVRGPASLRGGALVAIVVPLAALAGLRVAQPTGQLTVEVALGFAAIAVAISAAPRGRAVAAAIAVALAIPALSAPRAALVVLLHGHNLVGFALWLAATRATVHRGHRLAVIAATAIVALAILGGALDGLPHAPALAAFAPALAPGVTDELAYRVVLVYLFLQAMHYVVWLRLIPITQAAAPSASPFRRSLAGLRADFGTLGLAAIAAAAISVPVVACLAEPMRVRDGYLAIAGFHAWLELAIGAYLLAARERLA
jgi:hypothetical protein